MWKLLQISQQPYFFYCSLSNTQNVTFILYDLKRTWSQTISLNDVKNNVKLLNKRFDFNEDNIKDALMSDAIQSAFLEEDLDQNSCLLKLKYRIKNCFLNYEWTLRKEDSLQQTFVQPLLLALGGCYQQVEILTDSIRKKDMELKQFRIEGAVLNRKTLVTKPFDFDNFNKKFEDCNKTAINFRGLAQYLKEHDQKEEPEITKTLLNVNKVEQDTKFNKNLKDQHSSSAKMSLRQRKRQANKLKMQHLEQHLKLRKQGLEYESSQSQTPNTDNSQTIENPKKHTLKSKIEITLSPRRSSRSIAMQQKQYYMSSDEKTDSDNDNYLRTDIQRKLTRSLVNQSRDSDSNSNDAHFKSNSKDNKVEETNRRYVKSLSLSNNSGKKSFEKSSEISNIFAFPNESEDEGKKIEKRSKSDKDLLEINKNKLINNNSILSAPIEYISHDNVVSMSSPSTQNLSQSPTPVIINEISSQLNNIRKELETLEAMRLADLKQRTCEV